MTVRQIAKRTEKFVTDNSPTILTALAVAGTLTTAYLTAQATFKASNILRSENTIRSYQEKQSDPSFPTKDKVKLVWKEYIPAAGTCALTVLCIVGANRVETRRAAALASAYTISERAFTEYKDKMVEKLGDKKEQAARDEIQQDRVNRLDPAAQVFMTGNGNVLFMDAYSGRPFRSSMEAVKKAVNDINYEIIHDGYASLSEFYDKIELDHTAVSDEVGWTSDEKLEVDYSTTIAKDAEACIVINFRVQPFRKYASAYR